jgi:hypothetical protein
MGAVALQRVYRVEPGVDARKTCDICRDGASERFLLASSERAAQSKRSLYAEEGHNGRCAACMMEFLMGEERFAGNGGNGGNGGDAGESYALIRGIGDPGRAAGITLPAVGTEVNGGLPPAGEPYHHENFEPGADRCPIEDCDGHIERVNVVSDTGDGGEPATHLDTLEASCSSCQRVFYKSENVAYEHHSPDVER